jgi:hydrogenase maturation protease
MRGSRDLSDADDVLREALAAFFAGRRAAVVGVGNDDRGDDGFGPAVAAGVAQALACPLQIDAGPPAGGVDGGAPAGGRDGALTTRLPLVIDAGVRPENCLDALAAGGIERVLFVDAVAGSDGEFELALLDPCELVGTAVSSHRLPLALVATLAEMDTGTRVKVLTFPAGSLERFTGLGPAARGAAARAARLVAQALEAGGRA